MTDIAALIEQQTALVRQLLGLLEEEEYALTQAAAEKLADIGNRKQGLVERLNALDAERARAIALRHPDLSAADALHRWLDAQGPDAPGRRAWTALLALVREVRERHDLNGQLIRLHLQQTGQALAALQAGEDRLNVYGSDGQTSSPVSGRISDSA